MKNAQPVLAVARIYSLRRYTSYHTINNLPLVQEEEEQKEKKGEIIEENIISVAIECVCKTKQLKIKYIYWRYVSTV